MTGKIGVERFVDLRSIITQPRPFWQQFLIILGIVTLTVLIMCLLMQDLGQISNLYFWSSILLFGIAAIPIFTEVGTSAKITGQAVRKGEKAGPLLAGKKAEFDRGARTTYLFGLSGLVTMVLSILTIPIG